jgi:hypothetical protein
MGAVSASRAKRQTAPNRLPLKQAGAAQVLLSRAEPLCGTDSLSGPGEESGGRPQRLSWAHNLVRSGRLYRPGEEVMPGTLASIRRQAGWE